MKRKIKVLLSGLVIVALTVGMLAYLTRLVERKDSYTKNEAFYRQDVSFDALFFGTSHVLCGVYPLELWQDYGIVSYNCGISGSYMPEIYWSIVNSLEYTTPELIVIDCYRISDDSMMNSDSARQAHEYFDTLPLSGSKAKVVWNIFSEEEDRLEYLWDFIVYHDRWAELERSDFVPYLAPRKGERYSVGLTSAKQFPLESEEKLSGETLGVRYLRKAIELCQSNGIEVLLTYLPFPANQVHQNDANRVYDIAEEYRVGYIDFLHMDRLIDWQTDCQDYSADGENGHMNACGARKLTDYLGKYIREHYDLPDRRDDPAYKDWEKDYQAYTELKVTKLAEQKDVRNYLMLLHDKHLSFCVYLGGNSLWRENNTYVRLLANAWIDPEMLPDGPSLAVVDNLTGNVSYLTAGEAADTGFGRVALTLSEGAYTVQIDGESAMEMLPNADAGAVVIDNGSGAAATSSQFAVTSLTVNKIS